MRSDRTVRKSHCNDCGQRLSEKTPSGQIHWKSSHVDDHGFYCEECFRKHYDGKSGKPSRK